MRELPNIILLVLDTLRYDYAMADPFFCDLSKKGIFFERMYSASTFTNATMTSLRTGMYPTQHGWRSWPKSYPISEDIKTLEDRLSEAGYHVANRITMPMVLGETQTFIEDKKLFAKKTIREPFFLYSQYMGIHDGVFFKEARKMDITEGNYKSLLPAAGNFIKLAFQRLENRLPGLATLCVIMSDHGVGLENDKLVGEGLDVGAGQLYDFRIRTYCLIMGSDIEPSVLNKAYSHIDLMPTILDYCGIPTEDLQGRSAFRDYEIEEDRLIHLEAQSPHSIWPSEPPNVFGTTNGKVKLMITPDGAKLYDLQSDPDEKNDLLGKVEASGKS